MQGRAFFLRPDTPAEGRAREPKPGEEDGLLAEPLRTYAAEAGLIMRRPSLTPYTILVQEATEYAQEQGQFDTFHRAAYKALWEEDKNLGDMTVIQEIAEGCGLNWPEMSRRLESGHYRTTVQQQYQQAMDMGIHGIPGFLMENFLFTGAQPYDVFKMAANRALSQMEE